MVDPPGTMTLRTDLRRMDGIAPICCNVAKSRDRRFRVPDKNNRTKPGYESPTLVPLGELATGAGACVGGSIPGTETLCNQGTFASGGCNNGIFAAGVCDVGGQIFIP
jgi:hypothetical protein